MRLLRYLLVIVILLALISCIPKVERKEKKIDYNVEDLGYDSLEQTVYDVIIEDHEFFGVPFITYIVLGYDDDTFYQRVYIYAMISDIDGKLNIRSSLTYPFAFIFDKDTHKLIRYFYPRADESYDVGDFQSNFPLNARKEFLSLPVEQHIERIEKLSSTNLWKAMIYFDIEDEIEHEEY